MPFCVWEPVSRYQLLSQVKRADDWEGRSGSSVAVGVKE